MENATSVFGNKDRHERERIVLILRENVRNVKVVFWDFRIILMAVLYILAFDGQF